MTRIGIDNKYKFKITEQKKPTEKTVRIHSGIFAYFAKKFGKAFDVNISGKVYTINRNSLLKSGIIEKEYSKGEEYLKKRVEDIINYLQYEIPISIGGEDLYEQSIKKRTLIEPYDLADHNRSVIKAIKNGQFYSNGSEKFDFVESEKGEKLIKTWRNPESDGSLNDWHLSINNEFKDKKS